jgi:hypothetical protein
VPSSVPKYTRPLATNGEDSAREGSLRDQRTRPFLASSAITRPCRMPFPRARTTAYTLLPAHAGDDAAR